MLSINNIQIQWDNHVILNACAHFYEGCINTITGDNGIGKTSLLYYLSLFKKSHGEYIYNDDYIDLNCMKQMDDFRYHHIFVLLQELSLYDEWKLKDYLDYMSDDGNYDIDYSLNKTLKEFSFGEKQYILLYGGYLAHKDIYILDEPTAHLDLSTKQKMMNLILELKKQKKIMIIVTHDQNIINQSDILYQIENKQMILVSQNKTQLQPIYQNSQKNHNLIFLKTRLYSKRNQYLRYIIIGLTLILSIGIITYHNYHQSIKDRLEKAHNQTITIHSTIEPILSSDHCMIEYISSHQYLITFTDSSEFSFIMKELQNQYSLNDIDTDYLEDKYIDIFHQQLFVLELFYNICIILSCMIMSYIYAIKTETFRIQHILLVKLLGYNKYKEKLLLFLEICPYLIIYPILMCLYKEFILILIFILIQYICMLYEIRYDFVELYR